MNEIVFAKKRLERRQQNPHEGITFEALKRKYTKNMASKFFED
jgi:hypothetical protein